MRCAFDSNPCKHNGINIVSAPATQTESIPIKEVAAMCDDELSLQREVRW